MHNLKFGRQNQACADQLNQLSQIIKDFNASIGFAHYQIGFDLQIGGVTNKNVAEMIFQEL
jgi:hypothetical protein